MNTKRGQWSMECCCCELRIIHCSGATSEKTSASTCCRSFWCIDFVYLFAMFESLRTNPMSDITLSQKPSRAAAMSNIRRFSDVFEPFEMKSKRDLESVNKCRGTARLNMYWSSWALVTAVSNISLKAMTLPVIAERVPRRDLYDLINKCMADLLPSDTRTICPSCGGKSWSFAKDESENPITLRDSLSALQFVRV